MLINIIKCYYLRRCGGMVDAPDSKSGEGNFVRVRVSPALPKIDLIMKKKPSLTSIFLTLFATGITIVTNGNKKVRIFWLYH